MDRRPHLDALRWKTARMRRWIPLLPLLLVLSACGRTCPPSNVSPVTSIAIGRIGVPREAVIAHSEAELTAFFAKAAPLGQPSVTADSADSRAAFLGDTDFAQFDVAIVNVDDADDFQGTLRNGRDPDVAAFFDGPDDTSLLAVVGPHCGRIHDSRCGVQTDEVVIPRAVVFRVPKGTVLRVTRCKPSCPSSCGPHS